MSFEKSFDIFITKRKKDQFANFKRQHCRMSRLLISCTAAYAIYPWASPSPKYEVIILQEKITSFLLLLAIAAVHSWPGFQKQIPNGDKVPCKCVNGMLWKPVGHYNDKLPTKLKNPFGLVSIG